MREVCIVNTFSENLVLKRFPDGHLRNFQGQRCLTNGVYFHLGRHMDALIHKALCWVFFTIIWADVVGQEAAALWTDFMNMTPSFAKTDAMLCWWIISHLKPKAMISMWHWSLQIFNSMLILNNCRHMFVKGITNLTHVTTGGCRLIDWLKWPPDTEIIKRIQTQ